MARAEREPITGVWGLSPQRESRGRAPVGGQEGEAPLKLNAFFACPKEAANLPCY